MQNLRSLSGLLLVIILNVIVIGCFREPETPAQSSEVETISIDTLQVIASFETHNIAQPNALTFVENQGVYIMDVGQKTISLINADGELVNTLGGEGRGPGEFMSPASIQAFSEVFLVVDNAEYRVSRFDYQGNFLNNYPFSTQDLSRAVELIEDSVYVTGTNTQSDSLLQLTNLKTNTTFTFGVPKDAKFTGVDLDQSRNQMQRGEIPDFMKNFIRIQSDGSHIFVYFNSYSELYKYTIEGTLVWKKEIDLPYNDELFERTVERSRDTENTSAGLQGFAYISGFDIYNDEIYILTLPFEEKPQLLVKLNSMGDIQTIYKLPMSDERLLNFSLDTSTETAYFSSFQSGLVYKATLSPS